MQKRLRIQAIAHITDWGLDAEWMENPYSMSADKWDLRYAAYLDPLMRTPLITAEKTAARKVYEPLVSQLAKGLRVNPRVSENDRLELGLPDYDTTPTQSQPPHSWPVATITPVGAGLLRIDVHDSETGHKGKGPDIHGHEMRFAVLPEPPKSVEEILRSEFSTRSSHTLEFDQILRGKTVYFCFRWENNRGQKGPWSEILIAIIP
jgi:hypothetical protein